MIEEQARVVAIDGTYAEVEAERGSSCGSCAARSSCGTSTLSRFLGSRTARIRLENRLGAECGDRVVIGVPEQALPKASFLVYILPLLTLLSAAMLGEWIAAAASIAERELFSVIGGGFGLWAGIRFARHLTSRTAQNNLFQPVMLRKERPVAGIGIPLQ